MAHWRCCGSLVAQVYNTAVWSSSVFFYFSGCMPYKNAIFFCLPPQLIAAQHHATRLRPFWPSRTHLACFFLWRLHESCTFQLSSAKVRRTSYFGATNSGDGATLAERAPPWRRNFRQLPPLLTITSPTSTAIFVLADGVLV